MTFKISLFYFLLFYLIFFFLQLLILFSSFIYYYYYCYFYYKLTVNKARFIADLNGAQEVPPVESPFSGHASVDFDYSSREVFLFAQQKNLI